MQVEGNHQVEPVGIRLIETLPAYDQLIRRWGRQTLFPLDHSVYPRAGPPIGDNVFTIEGVPGAGEALELKNPEVGWRSPIAQGFRNAWCIRVNATVTPRVIVRLFQPGHLGSEPRMCST